MPVADLMMEGVRLMALGMGIVFSFLVILVFAMTAMSRLARKIQPVDVATGPQPVTLNSTATGVSSQGPDSATIAVIGAAIAMFRKNHE